MNANHDPIRPLLINALGRVCGENNSQEDIDKRTRQLRATLIEFINLPQKTYITPKSAAGELIPILCRIRDLMQGSEPAFG